MKLDYEDIIEAIIFQPIVNNILGYGFLEKSIKKHYRSNSYAEDSSESAFSSGFTPLDKSL